CVVTGKVLLPDGKPAPRAKVADGVANEEGGFLLAVESGTKKLVATWTPPGGASKDELYGSTVVEVPDGGASDKVVIRLLPKSFVVLRIFEGAGRVGTEAYSAIVAPTDKEMRGDVLVLRVQKPVGEQFDLPLMDARPEGARWPRVAPTVTTQASADGA